MVLSRPHQGFDLTVVEALAFSRASAEEIGANWAASRLSVLGFGGACRLVGALVTELMGCDARMSGRAARVGGGGKSQRLMKSKRPMENFPNRARA